ncbi:MAG TPA: YkgJ family cysteine cluster protein [Bacillota bacterium]
MVPQGRDGPATLPLDRPLDRTPCVECRSECCRSVPVRARDWQRLLVAVAAWPRAEQLRLACQARPVCMCPFVDVERWRCSVYRERPLLCRLYGYAPGLACPHAPALADRLDEPTLARRLQEDQARQGPLVGVLGVDLDWSRILDALRQLEPAARGRGCSCDAGPSISLL